MVFGNKHKDIFDLEINNDDIKSGLPNAEPKFLNEIEGWNRFRGIGLE